MFYYINKCNNSELHNLTMSCEAVQHCTAVDKEQLKYEQS